MPRHILITLSKIKYKEKSKRGRDLRGGQKTSKAQLIEGKNDKFDLIKIKSFCSAEDLINRKIRQDTD